MHVASLIEIPSIEVRFPIWLLQTVRPGDAMDGTMADQTWVWAWELEGFPDHRGAIVTGHRLGGSREEPTANVFARLPELLPAAEVRIDDEVFEVYAVEVLTNEEWCKAPWREHEADDEVLQLNTCYWRAAGDDVEASCRLFAAGESHDSAFVAYCRPVGVSQETVQKSTVAEEVMASA